VAIVAGRDVDDLFAALSQDLGLKGVAMTELCVIGGAALAMLGLVERPTKDIDVVALAESSAGTVRIRSANPLPAELAEAVAEVSRQMGVEAGWLNCGPSGLVDWGLPDGFEARLVVRDYGAFLRIHFASRLDQICFKTYAAADVAGRHLTDLLALAPSAAEMDFAFRWVVQQDPSSGFGTQLELLADYMEVRDVLDHIRR
jgi:hypothetical protein